ncbi:SGM_5486 family transporter-associated protein [Streptomyces coryli]|nr:SGM_5486 family transporter-associated protein [Streptomyces coryli]
MPVLEPNPQGGQRKFLGILGVIALITIVISVVATVLS